MSTFPVPRCSVCDEPWPVFAVYNRVLQASVDFCRAHAPIVEPASDPHPYVSPEPSAGQPPAWRLKRDLVTSEP
jgi:hypothetical protein